MFHIPVSISLLVIASLLAAAVACSLLMPLKTAEAGEAGAPLE